MSTTIIRTCDDCAAGVSNDDWSHLDFFCCCSPGEAHEDDCEAERMHASCMATMELTGYLTPVDGEDAPGYFDCALCGEIQCGGGHTFETSKDPSR